MGADDILDTLATTQHGVVARHQLLTAGMTPSAIDRRLARSRLIAVHQGVYRVRGQVETWPQRLIAAVLSAGPAAVASHRAAGFLHGLAGIEPRAEVTVGMGRGVAVAGVVVHRSRRPPRPAQVGGVPSTGAARTLIDLASVVDAPALEEALDDALTRRLVTVGCLRRRLSDLGKGRSGAATLGEMLDQRGDVARPQNIFERRLFGMIAAAGLPLPVPQYEVRLGDRKAFLDFAYPELQLALEADSYQHHSSKAAWERDRVRNRALTAMGWRILPVTWGDIRRPEQFLAELCVADPALRRKPRTLGA